MLYSAVLFAAISAMKCFNIYTTRQAKIILPHGRMITMMQPSILLICFTLVASFAGLADAFFLKGPCLNVGTGNTNRCTAGGVTGMVTNYTGPSTCVAGSTIVGNITTTLTVNSANRYDIGVYVGLNGANAKTASGPTDCLLQPLRAIDDVNNGIVSNIDNDVCLDSQAGVITGFQINNVEILCNSAVTGVEISACFVWTNNRNNICPKNCTSPNDGLLCMYQKPGSVSSVKRFTIQIQ